MTTTNRRSIAWALASLLAPAAATLHAGEEKPTYHKQVVRILQNNCQDCHRPGQVAPFSLLTYEQARKRASDLVRVTEEKQMPPWPASPHVGGPFLDQRVLADADVATLKAWVDAGCPEGDNADAPPAREFAGDWPLGKPDLVLTMPEPYALNAEGTDDFRVFVLKTDLPEDRWIRAVDFKPGNRTVVHHIISAVDTSGRARELDANDPGPGYFSTGFGDGVPLRAFLPIWTPGSRPREAPEGAGYVLPKGADVLIQIHYHKSGKPETDATSIGLYLSDKPLPKKVNTGFVFPNISMEQMFKAAQKIQEGRNAGKRPNLEDFMKDVLEIPADAANYEVRGSTKDIPFMSRPLQRDILITAVMPHMHWLGKDFAMKAMLPDGGELPLIQIDRWNFNWQGTYVLEKPLLVPKGSWFEMVAHFDNSASNPFNPRNPPQTVTWGNETNDEMCLGVFEFVNADADAAKPKP